MSESAFGVDHGEFSKGWGGDSAARTANAATKARLKAPKKPRSDAKRDHERRAWGKFTNLQERSNAGKKISPMRSRSFAPLENQLPAYGGRTGSNWEFNGNKRVRKNLDPFDVEKAFGSAFKPPKMGAKKPKPNPSQQFAAGRKVGNAAKQVPGQAKAGVGALGYTAGAGTQAAGKKASGAGQSMMNSPFKTGAAIMGGGGALTGGLYANRKKKPGQPNA